MRKFAFLALILLLTAGGIMPMVGAQMDAPPGFESWEDVVTQAEGQTVNWYVWGGSDGINAFVDDFYGPILEEEYGVTLNRVPMADTVDAVNQVLSESEAGVADDGGTIDLIWINLENFFTLKQADLLYGPWSESIPNAVLVDWDNPAVYLDGGRPIEGFESPWSSAQFHFMYNTDTMGEAELPHNYTELSEWIQANPGQFTYIAPGPGGFVGTRFVKQLFFELSGDHNQWVGEFNQELYDEWAPQVWALLNSWKPYLWREGETYPTTEAEMHELFANSEVAFDFTQSPAGAAPSIAAGVIPETSKAFTFDANMVGDFNYVAIPYNAPNKAAALVLANLILRPDRQAEQVQPANGFCCGWGIDVNRVVDDEGIASIEAAFENLGSAAADPNRLAKALVSDIAAEYQALIEADWEANVLRGE